MKEITRKLYNSMSLRIAKTYGVDSVIRPFAATPELEQRLQDKIVELDDFLQKINVITVGDKEGQNILGSASGPSSGRTDTSVEGNERSPKDLLGLDTYAYNCRQTNSDVYMRYATMDVWAKFKDLPERYARYLQQRIANDRCLIGWFGESAAVETDLVANPLMEDVNEGWLQYMRDKLPANILTEGGTVGEIRIGTDGDFLNLDHAVADLVEGIPQYLRQDLVVLIGSELMAQEKSVLYQAIAAAPTEKTLATASLSTFGGIPAATPNNFPARGLVITSYKNLSIYVQEGTWRRHMKDKPEKDRVEDFNSRNEGYVVETPEKFVGVDFKNVKLPDGIGGWA
ncbi:MAG: phage major capsid protein, P2 family [Desulforhopalus sp.]